MKLTRSLVLSAAVLTAAATLTACNGDAAEPEKTDAGAQKPAAQTRSAVAVMTAATEKTAEAGSARIEMTVDGPGTEADTELEGVMGWNPMAMDVTVSGEELAAMSGGAPGDVRMLWSDGVMYMDMGASAVSEMDGKRWMKLDLAAAAEASGDEAVADAMTSSLQDMQQSPAQQMGMLLEAEDIRYVGEEKLDGVATRHYQGTLTMQEALEANKSLDFLDAKEREQLLDSMEASGIEGYDIEAWLNEDDMPVRVDMTTDSPEGEMTVSQKLSDFGAELEVDTPPASETFDLMEMLQQLGEAASSDPELEAELKELEDLEGAA